MENPALWTTTQQVSAIKSGKLTSRELLEIIIDRISRLNPAINAVITTDFDRARKLADDFDKMNRVYATYFTQPFPARSCIEVSGLAKEAKVEIEAIALL